MRGPGLVRYSLMRSPSFVWYYLMRSLILAPYSVMRDPSLVRYYLVQGSSFPFSVILFNAGSQFSAVKIALS